MVFPLAMPVVYLDKLSSHYILHAWCSKRLKYMQISPLWGNLGIVPFRTQKTGTNAVFLYQGNISYHAPHILPANSAAKCCTASYPGLQHLAPDLLRQVFAWNNVDLHMERSRSRLSLHDTTFVRWVEATGRSRSMLFLMES